MQVSSKQATSELGAFAALLSKIRVERSLTRSEVADRVGVSPSVIDSYESGKAVPGSREWARYCNMVSHSLRRYDTEYRAAYNIMKNGKVVVDIKPASFNPPKLIAVPKEEPKKFTKELFGAALSKAITDNKISYTDVAETLEVTLSAISKWVNGVSVPTDLNMKKLIELLPELNGWMVVAKKATGPMGKRPNKPVQEPTMTVQEVEDLIKKNVDDAILKPTAQVIPITISPTDQEQKILLLLRRNTQAQESLHKAQAAMEEAERVFKASVQDYEQAKTEALVVSDEVQKTLKL